MFSTFLRAADALELWLGKHSELLIACLIAVVCFLLAGCATQTPIAERGTVLVTWEVAPERVPGRHCGWATEIAKGHYLVVYKRRYGVTDQCVVHELAHAMGAED